MYSKHSKTSDEEDTPQEIREAAKLVSENLLPDKSGNLYRQCYNQFVQWQTQRKTKSTSEETMLVYFDQLSKQFKPSTVWSKFSMLKTTLMLYRGVDIGPYRQLSAFLGKNSKGFASKKSEILEPKHVERFLKEAPDSKYLAIKVALILGITGACRREELKNLTINDVVHYTDMVVVKIPRTKNDVARKFTVDGDFYKIFRKYEAVRPKETNTDRFFLCLRDGKCTQQVIVINTFGAMPKVIATYLGLPNPEKYTGHSFRRTSATMLADAGADLLTLKRHGGWKSDKVAMGYVADWIENKRKICKQICSSINLNRPSSSKSELDQVNLGASTSGNSDTHNKENSPDLSDMVPNKRFSVHLNNCQVTFNFAKDEAN